MEKNKIKRELETVANHRQRLCTSDILMPDITMFGDKWDKFTNEDLMLLKPYVSFGVLDLPKKTMEAKRNE